ncbi:MAG: LptF/LptG family permease [Gemmatimonadales bacterium]|nr:LptF/LptG family permease [Gemmatimonadales bacterium]MBP7620246.1 LptF/LptG family permease [Gemmatimonadales bacterium]
MRLLSRHILRSLAAPFGWGVVALTGMLLLNQLYSLIDRFGGKGLPFSVMGEAILLALPALLTLTLPMSVLTSALYAYGQLAADLEMVAMYANGVSVWRMARPALLAACVISGINFLVFDQVVPRSNARFTTLQQDVVQKLPTLTLRPQVLNPLPNQYVLRAAEIDPVSGALTDVTIYDLSSYQGSRVIRAARGVMGEAPNRTDLVLTLYDGVATEVKSIEPGRLERTTFAVNRVRVPGVANQLTRSTNQWDRSDRELTGCELLMGIDSAAWYRKEGKSEREVLTRRDLRRLAGLPALPPPAIRQMPALPTRCAAYRPVERWFERLILGREDTAFTPPVLPPPAPTVTAESIKTVDSFRPSLPVMPAPGGPVVTPATPPPGVIYRLPGQPAPGSAPTDSAVKQDSTPPKVVDSVTAPVLKPRPASLPPETTATVVPAPVVAPLTTTATTATADGAQAPLVDGSAAGQAAVNAPQQGFLVPPTEVAPVTGLASTIVDVNSARYQDERNLKTTREFGVEYHKKFAIPLSAFGFVLVAMALALKYPRSGIGLVIGGSLLIFLGFYVLLIGGENLANVGYISAAVAMYGPLVIFTLLGLVMVASANREMGTSRTSGILQAIGEAVQSLIRRRRPEAA